MNGPARGDYDLLLHPVVIPSYCVSMFSKKNFPKNQKDCCCKKDEYLRVSVGFLWDLKKIQNSSIFYKRKFSFFEKLFKSSEN